MWYRELIQAGYLLAVDRNKGFQLGPPEQSIMVSKNSIKNLMSFESERFSIKATPYFFFVGHGMVQLQCQVKWQIMQIMQIMQQSNLPNK